MSDENLKDQFEFLKTQVSDAFYKSSRQFLEGTEEDLRRFWVAITKDLLKAQMSGNVGLIKEIKAQVTTVMELKRIRLVNATAPVLEALVDVGERMLEIGIRSVLRA